MVGLSRTTWNCRLDPLMIVVNDRNAEGKGTLAGGEVQVALVGGVIAANAVAASPAAMALPSTVS